jgi:hypothetical protein
MMDLSDVEKEIGQMSKAIYNVKMDIQNCLINQNGPEPLELSRA